MGLALLVGVRPDGVSAHAELVSSNPVDGSTVDGPVTSIFITFGEGVKHLNDLSVKDQSGKPYKVKSIDYADKNVTLNLDKSLNSGKFTVKWDALSVDGHLAPGELSFTVGSSTKSSQATPNQPKEKVTHQVHSNNVITYLLGALLLIIIIGFFAILRRKKA